MAYIQEESKKWRSGLDFTSMTVSTFGSFKRPKVWSNTRMVNFEFEKVLRFLECKNYWKIPNWVEDLALLYLPVTFVIKVMMKNAQSTKVKSEYMMRVYGGTNPDGKICMLTALKYSSAILRNDDTSAL